MSNQVKRPVGRPRKVVNPIQEVKQVPVDADARGNPLATFPGDRNGQLLKRTPDQEERQDLITSIMRPTLEIYKQKPCANDKEVVERIDTYFEDCCKVGVLPTVEGLSLVLGVSKCTVRDWEQGRYNAQRGPIIARAKEVIAEVDAQLTLQGKMPPIPYIFRAKNFYGMQDKTEVAVSVSAIDQFNEEELKRSIDNTIIDVPNFDITKK